MSARARPAGAKRTAEAAELRKPKPERPESKARRGVAGGKGKREDCGRTAERVRNLSTLSLPSPIPAPEPVPTLALVRPGLQAKPREGFPAEPPTRHGDGWPEEAPPSLVRGLPAHEQAVIDAALAILGRRVREPGAVFDSPCVAREYLRLHLAQCERERFGVMFLDAQHAVIAFEVLFEGTLTQTSVYPREVLKRSLQLNAAAVILAHNHPSGGAEPSQADKYLTDTLRTALRCIDVHVLDHLVIGWPAVTSFAERGLMEPEPARATMPRAVRRGARVAATL